MYIHTDIYMLNETRHPKPESRKPKLERGYRRRCSTHDERGRGSLGIRVAQPGRRRPERGHFPRAPSGVFRSCPPRFRVKREQLKKMRTRFLTV